MGHAGSDICFSDRMGVNAMVNRWRLGGINHGLSEWLFQRLTAVYIGLFGLFVIFRSLYAPFLNYSQWHVWMNQPLVKIGWAVFIFSLLYHGWAGMRSVFMDYAKPLWVRFFINALSTLFFLAMLIWTLIILF